MDYVKKLTKHWHQILFNILAIILFIAFYGHFGDIIIDSFREAYIPEQMLNGQVLYKNIFCIYPPLAYIINSLLFKVFGTKLAVLYLAGLSASLGILNITYKISNKFLPRIYSLSIILLIISFSFLSPNVFNFIFPYSYGALYGVLFVLLSIYCVLKSKFQLAYVFYILAILSKYEFILLLPVILWYAPKKEFLKSLPALFIIPAIVFYPLFSKGLSLNELFDCLQIILSMFSSKTLLWFYTASGLTFQSELLIAYAVNFIKLLIPIMFILYFYNWFTIAVAFVYLWFIFSPAIFVYIFPLIVILFALNRSRLNKLKKFVIISSVLVSIKLFFALTLLSYGVFFVPFALLSLFILIPRKFKKSFFIVLLTLSLVAGIKNISTLLNKNVQVKTNKGIVYTTNYYGNTINELIEHIQKNKIKNKILLLPECLAVNFLADNVTDNKLYSLIPLYVEVFGNANIIQRLDIHKPEYIVISNYDTSNYYYSYFGQDYGQEIYYYILKNYSLESKFGKNFAFYLFKLKK